MQENSEIDVSETVEDMDMSINDRISGVRPSDTKLQDVADGRKGARRRWLVWGVAAAAVAAAGVAGTLTFQKYSYQSEVASTAGTSNDNPEPGAQPQPPAADDLFAKHAADAGVKVCGATYSALGKVLTNGARYTVLTETAKSDADKRSVQGIVGMSYDGKDGNYSGPAAGVVFAAPVGGNCEGDMVRVVPFAQKCESVVGLLPKGSTPISPIGTASVYQLATGGQAILLPSGTGCTAMSVLRTTIQ